MDRPLLQFQMASLSLLNMSVMALLGPVTLVAMPKSIVEEFVQMNYTVGLVTISFRAKQATIIYLVIMAMTSLMVALDLMPLQLALGMTRFREGQVVMHS